MLVPILYMRPTCPYCRKVLKYAEEHGLSFELRDIAKPENAAALRARGGKQQVPYYLDEANGVAMYESEDIVAYLQSKSHAEAP